MFAEIIFWGEDNASKEEYALLFKDLFIHLLTIYNLVVLLS